MFFRYVSQSRSENSYELTQRLDLVYHYDISTASTKSKTLELFLVQTVISNPTVKISKKQTVSMKGTWNIGRMSLVDNGDGTSRLTVNLYKVSENFDELIPDSVVTVKDE